MTVLLVFFGIVVAWFVIGLLASVFIHWADGKSTDLAEILLWSSAGPLLLIGLIMYFGSIWIDKLVKKLREIKVEF